MACSSSTIWSVATTLDSSSKLSSYLSNPSSMFLFFSTSNSNKPRRLIACSFDPISTKRNRTNHETFSLLHNDAHEKKIKKIKKGEADSAKKQRPFWQKAFFASKKMRSILLLNAITIVYASDISVIIEVEAIMDPASFSAVRFIMSAIPFLPFVFRSRGDVETRNAGIELGFWISLGYLLEALGLLTSDAGRTSFISLFTVIVVPLLDGLLGTTIPARTWFGVLMSALGVGMLECSGSPPQVGDLFNFLSAIFFGIHMLRTEHISRSTKKDNFLAILGYEVCVVAALSIIWVMIGGWFDGAESSNQLTWSWKEIWDWLVVFPWIPALYTGALSTGLCLWIEIAAMRDVSATETAMIYGMEPLWGAAFAWFLLGERWGAVGWIGAALVLGGSLVVQILGSSTSQEFIESKEKGDLLRVPVDHKLQNGSSSI